MHQRHRTYCVNVESTADSPDVAPDIESVLARAEKAVEAGAGLSGTGFWKAVAEVKSDPDLIDAYADRIATIDAAAFSRWAWFTVPLALGTTLMVLAVLAATFLVGMSYPLDGFASVLVFYLGLGALLVTTHGLAHLVVGSLVGIRFTQWFMGKPSFPLTGGVKIDYSTYLRTAPASRAWMHAAGALTTKAIPFLLIGAAIAADLPTWAIWALPVLGLATIASDVFVSTEKADWKRFRREMRYVDSD